MSEAANFTELEQDELDNRDAVQALWRMDKEARAAGSAAGLGERAARCRPSGLA